MRDVFHARGPKWESKQTVDLGTVNESTVLPDLPPKENLQGAEFQNIFLQYG